ncbi:MAG: cation-translocating P-type ATPase, partial [Phycisphaerales bacterium]|nr:cation-translocating P-type ATPase [Phycisphaerales bacterium]
GGAGGAGLGEFVARSPEALVVGDRVRIAPGEQVPTDARVVLGETSVDQSTITGESQPRDVGVGDELFAGTVNVEHPVEAIVTRAAKESSLQKVLALVTQAQAQREPVQQLIDKLSGPYTIVVLSVSLTVFGVWWLGLGREVKDAAYTAIALLIVMSPCALVIATPTATLAAISRAARGGVLFKGGQAIERLSRLRAIAFDKTGTLTVGRPSVREVRAIAWSEPTHLLAVASALEAASTHPIAEAIVAEAKRSGVMPAPVSELKNVTGRGVSGWLDGAEARLGSMAHTGELIPVCLRNHVRDVLATVQHQGRIAVVCVHDQQAAVFILSDAVRPGADCLVPRLHELDVRPVVMLTGDNRLTAGRVAATLKLDEFHAELLPSDKVAQVQRLKQQARVDGGTGGGSRTGVGVIGDGVNDAPALAAADVAIGIGSIGSDAALENADIVLLNDDLSAVPWAVGLARRARRTIAINLVFAIGAMVIMACAVVIGSLNGWQMPLWMGVLGHEGGTLLVVAHSLLLLVHRGIPICTCEDDHADAPARQDEVVVTVEGRVVAGGVGA